MSAIESLKQVDVKITAALKGPISNIDRALLAAGRKDIREAIALLTLSEDGKIHQGAKT